MYMYVYIYIYIYVHIYTYKQSGVIIYIVLAPSWSGKRHWFWGSMDALMT